MHPEITVFIIIFQQAAFLSSFSCLFPCGQQSSPAELCLCLPCAGPAAPLAPHYQCFCCKKSGRTGMSATISWHEARLCAGLASMVCFINVNETASAYCRPQQWMPTRGTQSAAQLLLPEHGLGAKACGFPRKCIQSGIFSLFRRLLQPVVSNTAANKTQDLVPSSTQGWSRLLPGPGSSGALPGIPSEKPSTSINGDLIYLFR